MNESFLIVHGLGGSGPDHWQTWLAGRLRGHGAEVSYPELPGPDEPRLDSWLDELATAVEALGPERVVVCHSLGSVAWLHLATRARSRLAGRVLLVAPPSAGSGVPEIAGFVPAPLDPNAVARAAGSTRIVCADAGDPYCPAGPATWKPLGVPTDLIEGGGHLNADAGYGPWTAVEAWCLDSEAVPVGSRGGGAS